MADIIRTETLSHLFLIGTDLLLSICTSLDGMWLVTHSIVIAAEVSLLTNYTDSDCLVSVNFQNGIQLCSCFVYIFMSDAILPLLPYVKQNICGIVESLLPA